MSAWIDAEMQPPPRDKQVEVLINHRVFLGKGERKYSVAFGLLPANVDYWKIGDEINGWRAHTNTEVVVGWREAVSPPPPVWGQEIIEAWLEKEGIA